MSLVKGGESVQRRLQVIGFIVVICLAIGGGALASSPQSALALTQDWAYSAIKDLGSGRDIPNFEVPEDVNRNQGALLVARLLQHLSGEDHLESRRFGVSKNVYLDSMIFSYNQRVIPEKALTVYQVESLYRLVLEFRDELEILGYAIQDFNLLDAQGWTEGQVGLFGNRHLLYSEQALAAARKVEAQYTALKTTEPSSQANSSLVAAQPSAESRNLWTGQFSSVARFLPASSSLIAQEPLPQQNPAIQIGNLELSGSLRPGAANNPSVEDSSHSEGAGYGISVRMGDLALRTALDLEVDTQLVPQVASTSVDLSLDWADLFTVSAGYRQRDRLSDDAAQDDPPVVTSLGVVVPINRGQVHLGMIHEWNFTALGGNPLPDGELAMKNTAELGLSYDFKNDSSLRFNYRLIDFNNVDKNYGAEAEAKATFSIKF